MKKLHSTNNRVALYLLKSKLEENNILCSIKNENPPLAGEIPSIVACPELWVINDNDYDQAMAILQTENSGPSLKKEPWTCPQCHEFLEKQFDVCWKCGHSRG